MGFGLKNPIEPTSAGLKMNESPSKHEPAKMWVRKVESQFRIRLSKEAAEYVTWLKAAEGFSINCIARLGPTGQLHLLPNQEEATFQKLKSSFEKYPPRAMDKHESHFLL